MQRVKDIYCTENWFVNFFVEKKYRLYRHLLIWVYLVLTLFDSGDIREFAEPYNTYVRIVWMVYFLIMVYINMYVLIPYFLFKAKYISYLMLLMGIIVVTFAMVRQVHVIYFDPHRILPRTVRIGIFREIVAAANILTMVVFSSTSIKLFQRWQKDITRMTELEKNSLQMELNELKNQINPHFLFNMLNNVNVLVTKDPEKASLIVVKLSDFLRYQLYENNSAAVQLSSEIQFLNDFMELEKIRRDEFTFSLSVYNAENDEMPQGLSLPPNMFIVFVENAIKYSVDTNFPSYVKADFTLAGNKLYFTCINSKSKEPLGFSGNGGLGLANVKRRLELLYGNEFSLEIRNDTYEYEVNLIVPV